MPGWFTVTVPEAVIDVNPCVVEKALLMLVSAIVPVDAGAEIVTVPSAPVTG
jgi:hypothetical protein